MSQKRRKSKSRGVVDTSVLVAGVAGMKGSVHESNVASAKFVQRWVEDRTFVCLITEEVRDEYTEVLARLGVRRPLIGKIVNTLRAKGEHVKPGPTRNLSPDPDDNHICDCAGGDLTLVAHTRSYLHDFADAVKSGDAKTAEQRILAKYPDYHVRQVLTVFSIPAFFPSAPST